MGITFGLCVPASCSVSTMESFINNAIPESFRKNVSVVIPSNTCQFEENASKLETLDIVTL